MDIIVRYLEHAPVGFHGMVTKNEDDTYTVLLDPNDSCDRILEAYFHELKHIGGDDLSKEDVQAIEAAAHSEEI